MEVQRFKAKVMVECEVNIDKMTLERAIIECGKELCEVDLANRVLYAFLNPKIDVYNDNDAIDGQWDNICEFNGVLENFRVNILGKN